MARTAMLYMPETMLATQSGVAVYSYDPGTRFTQLKTDYTPSPETIHYYEVAEITGQGSWWLPTAMVSQQPSCWPLPVVDLQTWGPTIPTRLGGEQVVRPETLFWWIEHRSLPWIPVHPGERSGSLKGAFPYRVPLQRPTTE